VSGSKRRPVRTLRKRRNERRARASTSSFVRIRRLEGNPFLASWPLPVRHALLGVGQLRGPTTILFSSFVLRGLLNPRRLFDERLSRSIYFRT
jgi:hypothetical protein